MQKTKQWLMTMAVLLCSITASAHDFEVDGIYYNITSSDNLTVEVTFLGSYGGDSNEYSGAITIPSTVTYTSKTYSVTSIGHSAFSSCNSLSSITIPESVTSIGSYAFNGCTNLASINIPKGVTNIENNTFEGCSSLASITIPESVTSIGDYAFKYCTALTDVGIPEGVTNIGQSSFEHCTKINSITIPGSVTSIGGAAFNQCTNLTSIVLPDGVCTVAVQLLGYCSSLTEVHIPSSVTAIQIAAFLNCTNIDVITCEAVIPPTVENHSDKGLPASANVFYAVPMDECVLYVPQESIDAYKEAYGWSSFTNILPIKKNLILNEGTDFSQTENEECASITYTRTFNNTNWQALYVPFEIPVTEELLADFEVADLNDIRQYDRDDDRVKDETVVEAFKVTSGALEANYPYLIRAKEAGEKTITVADATLYATEENSIDCSSVHEKYTFTGTYNTLDAAELAGCYALSGGVWQPVAEDASLGAFRFYLQIESRDDNAQATQSIKMRVIGDDTTEIENSELKIENSTFSAVYDLQGRRVENPTKGVYVVNGKKVLYN